MRRVAILTVLVLSLSAATALAATPEPKTVGQFHRLPKDQRREFALQFMTTHPVDPCDNAKSPLSLERARNVVWIVVRYVKPGPDAADGGYLRARATVGFGIRRILANVGC